MMFTGEGSEGKLMGLAPFGRPGTLGLPDLQVDEFRVTIPDAWTKVFAEAGRYSYFLDGKGSFEDCADLAAEGQRAFETALLKVVSWLHERTGAENLSFAGGTALNCSANGRIIRESPFEGVFIPPSPHDGGTALGCALYGMIDCLGQSTDFRWVHDFLGPRPDPERIRTAVETATAPRPDGTPSPFVVETPDDLAEAAVEILADGKVIAVHQGRSESGPRALGDRSIIADARNPRMQDFINFEVKGREWFRPLAPLVLSDRAQEIFDVDRPAPFMQYAADVRPEYREVLPAITHVDGSARLQTVNPDTTPFLHRLLSGFATRTGVPVLLNTSLNGKGDPLVETPEDSLHVLATTSLHALVMPPYLIRKREEPPAP
jgi:carbamoyltransferase